MPYSTPSRSRCVPTFWLVCGTFAVLFGLGQGARAAEADLTRSIEFRIPAQALAPALLLFSRQAHIQIATSGVEVGGIQSPGVAGVWPIGVALERLLAGTGFAFRVSGANSIAVLNNPVATVPNRTFGANGMLAQVDSSESIADNTSRAAVLAPVATKAERSAGGLEEIVVTARKREENAQDVPLSLIALNASTLSKIGFKSITDLKEKIAILDITPDNNTPSEQQIFIRGIGGTDAEQLTRDNAVGVYLDDVYVGHGMMLASQLLDIERIEVLPGPQGTLYGRNTVGGAVKFISEKPTGTFDVKDSLDVGNFGYVNQYASVNLPKMADISVKLSGLVSHIDGWVKNTGSAGDFGRKDSTGGRAAVRWQPADNLTVDYVIDHTDSHGTPDLLQYQYTDNYFGLFVHPAVSEREDQTWRPVNLPQNDMFIGTGNSVTALWGISEHVSLKSISAYREFDSGFFNDTVEGFNFPFVQATNTTQHQFSQELLLTGSTADSQLNYHLGLIYFQEAGIQDYYQDNNFATQTVPVPSYVPPTRADVNLDCVCMINNWSKAVYGEVTWAPPIFDQRLSIDVGGRSSSDTRGVSRYRPTSVAPLPVNDANEVTYTSFDPEVTIDYKFTPSVHMYGKMAKAYQAGGFDAFNNDYLHPFGPEHVVNYEVGVKSESLQHRLLVNADVFDEQYKNMQELFYDPNYAEGATETVNAGYSAIKGLELQIELVPVEALHLNAQVAHLETLATVTDPFTLMATTGALPNSPKWKGNLSAEYTFLPFRLGRLSAFVDYAYNARQLPVGDPELDYRPSYPLLDARISLSDIDVGNGKLVVSAWGKNLTDKQYETYHAYGAVQWGLPRSFGVNVTYTFGGV